MARSTVSSYRASYPAHKGSESLKKYAMKQIEICAEYRGMVPKASAGLSGTPGL